MADSRETGDLSKHWDVAYRTALPIVKDPAVAADIADKVIADVRAGLCPLQCVRLRARQRALNYVKKTNGERKVKARLAAEPRPVPPLPYEAAASADQCKRLRAALNRLDAADRRIIELRFFRGLSPKQIAQQLGIPNESTVRVRITRAKNGLIVALAKSMPRFFDS